MAAKIAAITGASDASNEKARSAAVADIFSQARMMPKYQDGEVTGLEFTSIQEGSLLLQQGLKNGDVVTEVNGVPIDSVSATSRVLTELSTVQDLNVKIQGPNGARTLNVPAAEVAKYLR
jgi:type II secretory pathway component PulC